MEHRQFQITMIKWLQQLQLALLVIYPTVIKSLKSALAQNPVVVQVEVVPVEVVPVYRVVMIKNNNLHGMGLIERGKTVLQLRGMYQDRLLVRDHQQFTYKIFFKDDNMRLKLPVAIIIIVIAVLAVYGSFYAYATTNIQPQDLKTFEEDLKNIESTKIPENEINTISNYANKIETGIAIKNLPAEQISTNAAAMKPTETDKTDFEKLNNKTNINQAIAIRYDFLLKGDIANEIRIAYNTKLVEIRQKMIQTQEQAANDFTDGNNTAVAADLKQYVQYANEYNSLINAAEKSLEKLVQQLNPNPTKVQDLRVSLRNS